MDAFIKEIYLVIKLMVKDLILILFRIINILDNGRMINRMEKENKNLGMEVIIKVFLEMVSKMVLGIMYVNQEFMKDNLKMVIFQEKELLIILIIVYIKDHGKMVY